jgi:alpha-galactosidase
MPITGSRVIHLRAAGVSFAVELTEPVPRILYWGKDLGDLSAADCDALRLTAEPAGLNSAVDEPRRFSVWPTEAEGWSGTPAHQGHIDGTATYTRLRLTGTRQRRLPGGGNELVTSLTDEIAGLDIEVTYQLTAQGMLAASASLTRYGPEDDERPYSLAHAGVLLPLPGRATEVLDFTGRWSRERAPQRRPRLPGGRGVGTSRGVERKPALPDRPAARGSGGARRGARRRRTASPRRGGSAKRPDLPDTGLLSRLVSRGTGWTCPPLS